MISTHAGLVVLHLASSATSSGSTNRYLALYGISVLGMAAAGSGLQSAFWADSKGEKKQLIFASLVFLIPFFLQNIIYLLIIILTLQMSLNSILLVVAISFATLAIVQIAVYAHYRRKFKVSLKVKTSMQPNNKDPEKKDATEI